MSSSCTFGTQGGPGHTVSPVLTLTAEEIAALDPLERLAARLMAKNGKAVIQEAE